MTDAKWVWDTGYKRWAKTDPGAPHANVPAEETTEEKLQFWLDVKKRWDEWYDERSKVPASAFNGLLAAYHGENEVPHLEGDLCGCECPCGLDCSCSEQADAPTTSILDDAKAIVDARGRDYDHPLPNHERIADLWSVILGRPVTPTQVVYCMIAVKLARLVATPDHRDSLVDIAGYAACAGAILDGDG
ncbi:MAG: DUF6378 domain-containing protein [Leptolyngbyaceae bacterium]|nr:DUF6378 domain-containing protein [Leptolyngbyaceae bacterium]